MKRKIVILVLMLATVFLTTTVNATSIKTLADINYKEKTITFLEGNHQFIYLTSETGSNDITINVTYSNITGWSLIEVQSNQINITWRFINNTKSYYYLDNITGDIYTIRVDYSSIAVPKNPDNETVAVLREKVEELEQINQTYNEMLENYTMMEETYSHYNETVTALKHNITVLKERINTLEAERDRYKDNYNNIKNDYDQLNENYGKLNDKYSKLKAKWDDIFTRLILPAMIAFIAGIVVYKGYEVVNKNKRFPRPPRRTQLKTKHYVEPEQFKKFKENIEKANLGKSYIEGAKEPYWKKIEETPDHIKYQYGKTTLEFVKKDEEKDLWDVLIDGQYYKTVIMNEEGLKNQTIEGFKKSIEEAVKNP